MHLKEEIKQTIKNRENFKEEVERYDNLITEEIEEKRRELTKR